MAYEAGAVVAGAGPVGLVRVQSVQRFGFDDFRPRYRMAFTDKKRTTRRANNTVSWHPFSEPSNISRLPPQFYLALR